MPIRYDAIWEFGFLEDLIGRDKVILQADFDVLLRDEEVRVKTASSCCNACIACAMVDCSGVANVLP